MYIYIYIYIYIFITVAEEFCPLTTHQHYLSSERWTSQKIIIFNPKHNTCGENRKYVSEHNQNGKSNENRLQPLKRF